MESSKYKNLIKGVYVITDETLVPGRTHVQIAKAAIAGGAPIIQLRDKDASDEYMIEAGKEIQRMATEAGALFIVNDRLDVALACDADGLHVGQSDRPAGELRRILGDKILGVSAATVDDAKRAKADGADYLGVGPVFATSTKSDAGDATGICLLPLLKAVTGLPIVAIGGINESNIGEVARSGVESASVISAVVCADDMEAATRHLVEIWEENSL
ncbi:MAG: thiamine phosphate synthase [Armatimonadota bacterium]